MKKGFTLIELLAVIVILAIIALIATPIVLNIIKDSRESAGLRSAEMYLDAVEQAVSIEKMNNTTFKPNECTITDKGNLDCDTKDGILEVKVNGDKPVNGKIAFEKGKIKKATLEYKNDKVIVMNTEGKLQYQEYISISNYQHKHTDGTIEDHEVTFNNNGHGTCSKCGEEVLGAGSYDIEGNLLQTWDELVELGMDIEVGSNPSSNIVITFLDSSATKFVIKKGITTIGSYQFYSASNLKEVIIPNSVTSIGGSTFSYCTSLKKIEIPDSVTSIGGYAFSYCTGLTTIEIPNSVTSIVNHTFASCTGLTSIKIPDSITSFSFGAFSGCAALTSIYIPSSVATISIPQGTPLPFDGCSSTLKIYTGVKEDEIPSGWGSHWNYYSDTGTLDVIYGVTREEYEATLNGA